MNTITSAFAFFVRTIRVAGNEVRVGLTVVFAKELHPQPMSKGGDIVPGDDLVCYRRRTRNH